MIQTRETSLVLPTQLTLDTFEETLHNVFQEMRTFPAELELDLSRVESFDIASLFAIIALIAGRTTTGLETKLTYPESNAAIDFLKKWNLDGALDSAKQKAGKQTKGLIQNWPTDQLLPSELMAIKAWSKEDGSIHDRLAIDENTRWQQSPCVEKIFAEQLYGNASYIASRIVYEAMSNALLHPNANSIQTASRFVSRLEATSEYLAGFTIAFWDDGVSLIETLRRSLKASLQIRVTKQDLREFYADYFLIREDSNGSSAAECIRPDIQINENTPDDILLMATTFPGITRDISRRVKHPFSTEKDMILLDSPGMGLYVLTNTVVDVFGGLVEIRTGAYKMAISKAKRNATKGPYKVHIRKYWENFLDFNGNLVIIYLPLKPQV